MPALASFSDTERIDLLNMALIGIAWGLALLIPFPLFLFAYAVLGPLHYLTEISWLHDRAYFIREAKGVKPFIIVSAIVSAGILFGQFPSTIVPVLVYSLFGGAFILAAVKEQRQREIAIIILFLSAILFTILQPPLYALVFALFIPTVVHVFFFTGVFMLSGALKSGSGTGLASCALLVLAAGTLFLLVPDRGATSPSQYVFDSYQPFSGVNAALMSLLSSGGSGAYPTISEIFGSRLGQAVMQFLAFAYTYHYLNWFSKSRIIGWNRTSPLRRNLILGSWITAVAVYAYDYRIGVQVLFFLSFLHVLLEFPLNHRSFADVSQRIAVPFRSRSVEA